MIDVVAEFYGVAADDLTRRADRANSRRSGMSRPGPPASGPSRRSKRSGLISVGGTDDRRSQLLRTDRGPACRRAGFRRGAGRNRDRRRHGGARARPAPALPLVRRRRCRRGRPAGDRGRRDQPAGGRTPPACRFGTRRTSAARRQRTGGGGDRRGAKPRRGPRSPRRRRGDDADPRPFPAGRRRQHAFRTSAGDRPPAVPNRQQRGIEP